MREEAAIERPSRHPEMDDRWRHVLERAGLASDFGKFQNVPTQKRAELS
jgi:hypothetical protein